MDELKEILDEKTFYQLELFFANTNLERKNREELVDIIKKVSNTTLIDQVKSISEEIKSNI
jgi:Mg2+/Co2+ transporter CorC